MTPHFVDRGIEGLRSRGSARGSRPRLLGREAAGAGSRRLGCGSRRVTALRPRPGPPPPTHRRG